MTATATSSPREADNVDEVVLPARARRRPLMMIGGVAMILLGALVSVWAFTATAPDSSVLTVRSTILRGDTITEDDLVQVTLSVDPALKPIPGDKASDVVGTRAALDIAAGSIVTEAAIVDTVQPGAGESIVGLSLAESMMPSRELKVGDDVRAVLAVADVTAEESTATTVDASIVGLSQDEISGQWQVNLLVTYDAAPELAAAAAQGEVSVILDSRER